MISQQDFADFFEASGETYRFFSQVLFKELNDQAIEELGEADFPAETGNDALDKGYRLIKRYFHFSNSDRRTQLAVEYARIFLAAGIFSKEERTAVPYESVFVDETHLVMGSSRDDCVKRYLADGFQVDPELHEPEDHIAFQFEYLANLCAKAHQAVRAADKETVRANIDRQRDFIDQHLLNWVPLLNQAAEKYAKTTFYTGVLYMAQGSLEQACNTLDAMAHQLDYGVSDDAADQNGAEADGVDGQHAENAEDDAAPVSVGA